MTDLEVFTYSGVEVRTVQRDGEPWFVAKDVCGVLGIANVPDAVRTLDDDEYVLVAAAVVTTDSRPQDTLNLVNEPGLYSLILRSRKPEAKAFKRWVTHEVLPAIRKTGRYDSTPKSWAEALQLAADQAREIEAKTAALAVAGPKAEAWDHLASAHGDYAVADTAKILSRDMNNIIGRDRLFSYLGRLGWVYRRRFDQRWAAYQTAVDAGWLNELPVSHYHPRTGDLILDPPQVRITVKGLAELRRRMIGGNGTANSQHGSNPDMASDRE